MAPSCGYHFTASAVSFGKGQSAVHKAAYNARGELRDERGGRQTRDYGYLGQTLFSGIFAPPHAPAWVKDREQLWNRAEAAERQKMNGQPARNIEFAFPHELNQQQREWLLKDFIREQFVRAGMIADAHIHSPDQAGDQRNFHAHVLLTMRELDGENFARTKNRTWNTRDQLGQWRERWAEMGARALVRDGHTVEAERWRHGHQTLSQQHEAAIARRDLAFASGPDREPTTHRGPLVDAMDRKGIVTDRAAVFRETNGHNAELATLKTELADIQAQIAAERELFIKLNELAMQGPVEVLGDGIKATVTKAVDIVADAASKAKEALVPKPAPENQLQRDGAERQPIDWQRYIRDRDYRRQVAPQQKERADTPTIARDGSENTRTERVPIDWQRYLRDRDYRRQLAPQDKQREAGRDRGPERDRGRELER